jgi:hypothetical protein
LLWVINSILLIKAVIRIVQLLFLFPKGGTMKKIELNLEPLNFEAVEYITIKAMEMKVKGLLADGLHTEVTYIIPIGTDNQYYKSE